MGSAGSRFDEQLFILKLSPISRQMQEESSAVKVTRGSFKNQIDAQIDVLSKYLENVDRVCREVWRLQGHAMTPQFVREILLLRILQSIGGREVALKGSIDMRHRRSPKRDTQMERHYLARAMRQLKATTNTRYEVEARELEYKRKPDEKAAGSNEHVARMFLEDGHGSSWVIDASENAVDYSKFSKKRLQRCLEKARARLYFLREQNPSWERAGAGYGNRGPVPAYYMEIRKLNSQRESIILELSKRRTLTTAVDLGIERPSRLKLNGRSIERRAFVGPRLLEKGWSTLDWAKNSNVDYHTADRYLKGEAMSYPSTRKKLAGSLGIPIADLPL
jgi:hypothetical protein